MKRKETTVQLYTHEGKLLHCNPSEIPWNEYPRPHLRRDSFLTLNGEWEFSVVEKGEEPMDYPERIRVPFVPESILSGIGRAMPKNARLCYRRTFSLPDGFLRDRVLLHVGAADQIAEVYLNGIPLGTHEGGYEPFSFDVTETLEQTNVLTIFVRDELDEKILPYGKQSRKRGGMWYTPVSGIWQTVWLESVPMEYVREVMVRSYFDRAEIEIEPPRDGIIVVHEKEGDVEVPLLAGKAIVTPKNPILWTPDTPYLYSFTLRVGEDEIESYFALRSLEIKTVQDIPRLCLNGEPIFLHGLLDQGYFSDGIFLPADPHGYERDILAAKELGFNLLRKHIKIEPERFYYECDRLGMLVAQDMVNNGGYSFLRDTALPTVGLCRRNDRKMHKNSAERKAFLDGMKETVRRLSFHPSVISWTIFNEGWGQFDHAAAYDALRKLDDSRWVDSVSGWFSPAKRTETKSDVESLHVYFKPIRVKVGNRPTVLSEFGGYAHKVEGHSFNLVKNYGYRFFSKREEFEDALIALYEKEVLPAVREGLCAAVYTQLSDVEDETNGLLTYDRCICKVNSTRMREVANKLGEAIKG